jgi:hypothetical protein
MIDIRLIVIKHQQFFIFQDDGIMMNGLLKLKVENILTK